MAVEVTVLLEDSRLHTLVFADADAFEDQGDRLVVTADGVVQATFRVWGWAMLIEDEIFADEDEDEGDVPPDGFDEEEAEDDEDEVTPLETVELPDQEASVFVPVSVSYDHDDSPGSNGASAGETPGQPE